LKLGYSIIVTEPIIDVDRKTEVDNKFRHATQKNQVGTYICNQKKLTFFTRPGEEKVIDQTQEGETGPILIDEN